MVTDTNNNISMTERKGSTCNKTLETERKEIISNETPDIHNECKCPASQFTRPLGLDDPEWREDYSKHTLFGSTNLFNSKVNI